MTRSLIDPRTITKEIAEGILPVNFGAGGPSRGSVDGAFEFYIDTPPDLSIMSMVDEMRAWVRFHVTSHLHDPFDEDDYLPKYYWVQDEDITVALDIEDGWITDHDCDGADTYRNRRATMRVYVDHVTDIELSAIIQHAPAERDIPSWVTGW